MRAHWVHVEHDFTSPIQAIFGELAEHENLGPVFGAKVVRLNDGEDSRNGVGSRRQLKVGPLPAFEETVTAFTVDQRIEYRITKGSPLREHVGEMRFASLPDGGTHLEWRIRVATDVPGLAAIVKAVLTKGIAKGLSQLDDKLAASA